MDGEGEAGEEEAKEDMTAEEEEAVLMQGRLRERKRWMSSTEVEVTRTKVEEPGSRGGRKRVRVEEGDRSQG